MRCRVGESNHPVRVKPSHPDPRGLLLPLLGLVFLPFMTLFYVLAYRPVVGVSGWGWFFLSIWIVILAHIVGDLFRDHSLSGAAKTLWVLFLVFLPFLAAFVYLIARGKGMTERSAA